MDRVYRCKVALAPYKKLPVEIMREIMLLSAGVLPSFPLPKETDPDPRLQITQVCADWRRIAFSITELWRIKLSRIPDRSSASKLINSWWSQFSGSQLSLMVNKRGPQKSGPNGYFENISFDHFLFENVIFPYSTRLVRLDIAMRAETARKMLALPAGSFKALKTLALTVMNRYDPRMCVDNLNTAFSASPSLSKVTIRTTSFTDPLLLCLPWQQLTQLVLGMPDIPADRLLFLISHCPSLSTCRINTVKDIDADTVIRITSMPLVRLKNLTELRLWFAGPLNHRKFLRVLLLPKVCDPTSSGHQIHDQVPSDCSTCLQSATSTLTHLQLQTVKHTWNASYHHFDELLMSYIPRVETFEVPKVHRFSSSALERIACGELLPSVMKMTFGVDRLKSALKMLGARLSYARKSTADGQTELLVIKTAVVRCTSSSGVDDMIQDLKDQGIDIKIEVLY